MAEFSFCFNMFSHPLYFSYFIFFSPYLFKLLSFLSPLFITTTLLFVALLVSTFNPNLVPQQKNSSCSHSYGFLVSAFQYFMSWVFSEADDEKGEEVGFLDELEAYLIMFQASIFEVFEPKSVEDCSEVVSGEPNAEFSNEGKREDIYSTEDANIANPSVEKPVQKVYENVEATMPIAQVKSIESLFQENAKELEEFCSNADCSSEEREDFCSAEEANIANSAEKPVQRVYENVEATMPIAQVKSLESLFQETVKLEDKEVKKVDLESNKVEESKEKWPLRNGSNKVQGYNNRVSSIINSVEKVKSQRSLQSNYYYLGSPESNNFEYSGRVNNEALCSSNLGSFGSMRVEKEWRRTLACKLFEERHNNGDGSDGGMDMLWETYETDSNKVILKKSNTKKGKKGEIQYHDDDDEEEEEFEEGKLCCLQALKFSAGKMNLGMGRPNLLKFSKALKGIGWLHHVGKNGKKV